MGYNPFTIVIYSDAQNFTYLSSGNSFELASVSFRHALPCPHNSLSTSKHKKELQVSPYLSFELKTFFSFFKVGSTPNVGLELMTMRSRVRCSTDTGTPLCLSCESNISPNSLESFIWRIVLRSDH